MSKDLIEREQALSIIDQLWNNMLMAKDRHVLVEARKLITELPQADTYEYGEWCKDCKEYDTEHHRCPRWNQAIRRTVEEMQGRGEIGEWIKRDDATYRCSVCGKIQVGDDVNELFYCCCCGSRNFYWGKQEND